MGKLSDERHVAKNWVDEHHPDAPPQWRSALIVAFGAGLDRGLAEAQEMLTDPDIIREAVAMAAQS